MNEKDALERIADFYCKIGAITEKQQKEIRLEAEKNPQKSFGTIAVEKGYLTDKSIENYIKEKKINWNSDSERAKLYEKLKLNKRNTRLKIKENSHKYKRYIQHQSHNLFLVKIQVEY